MDINDTLDAVLIGLFLFGLLFTAVSLAFGALDFGFDLDGDGSAGDGPSPLSVGSILAFLTWFGGVTYLLRNGAGLAAVLAIVVGIGAGLLGGWIIYRLLRVLSRDDHVITAEQDRTAMAAGQVLAAIRAGGIGEIVYESRGIRYTTPARSEDGTAIPAGAEVIVLRREGGVAVVQSWEQALESSEQGRAWEATPQLDRGL